MKKFFALLISLVSLVGCRVGPTYEAPELLAPEEWKNAHSERIDTPCVAYWWEIFNDELLNRLESLAVESNPNLYVALERVFEARAVAGAEAANLYPQLNLEPSYTSTGLLTKIFLPQTLPIPGLTEIPPFRIHQLENFLPLTLNYEVDLWGKLRDRYDSSAFNAEAQGWAYISSMLTLTSDLAVAYFQLRTKDAEIEILKSTIETRQKNYELTQNRNQKGLVNYVDVTQAEVDLANAQASLEDTLRQRGLLENQIAVLTGQFASEFCIEANPLKCSPPVIPPGVPSTILLQRPDIAQAERDMASEHALIGAAYASFFPSLSLTGTLGFFSPDAEHFLRWISRYWQVGAAGNQMVFDGYRDCYNLEQAIARFGQASGTYQQQVLIAFQEVEDALVNIEQQKKQSDFLLQAVEASRKATAISLSRYRGGVTIYLEVVENERLQLQAEVNWINVQGNLFVSTVQLIKALGGSWGGEEEEQDGCEPD